MKRLFEWLNDLWWDWKYARRQKELSRMFNSPSMRYFVEQSKTIEARASKLVAECRKRKESADRKRPF